MTNNNAMLLPCRLFPLLCRNDFQDITTCAEDKLHETGYCSMHPVSNRNYAKVSIVSIILFSFVGCFVCELNNCFIHS